MNSQYGICDAYYGLCRTLPPFMRFNTKVVLEEGATPGYDSTLFDGMEWLDGSVFLYADDSVMLEEAVLDSYDVTGASHQIADPIQPLSFSQQNVITNILKLFPTMCTETGYMTPVDSDEPYDYEPWLNGADYMQNNEGVTNNGIPMTVNDNVHLKTNIIPAFGACSEIKMSEELTLCFTQGKLHGWVYL